MFLQSTTSFDLCPVFQDTTSSMVSVCYPRDMALRSPLLSIRTVTGFTQALFSLS